MKHTQLLLAIAFILVGTFSFSQELEIDWGNDFDSKTEIQKVLGFTDDVMVAYSIKGKKRFIETYAKSGYGLKSTTEYSLPKIDGKQSGILNVALTGENVTTILYVYSRKTKSFSLFAHELSPSGKAKGSPKKIYTSSQSGDKIKDRKVDMRFSPDKSKALVFFDRKNKERTEFMSDMVVLDLSNELEVISETQHDFTIRSGKSEKVRFNAFHSVENDGSINLIREKVEYERLKIADFTLSISRYSKDGSEIGSTDLSEEGLVLLSPTMVVKDGKINVVGYYMNNPKNRSTVSGYSGLFSATLDEDMSLIEMKTNEFSDEFLKNVFRGKKVDRAAEKGKELLVPAPYTMNEIITHSDGSMTVLSEFYLVTVTQNKSGQTTTTQYGNILYFKLNSAGELVASDAIKKQQISSTTSVGVAFGGGLSFFASVEFPDKKVKYWSYASSVSDDNIYIVFNDHFKNAQDGGDDLSKAMANPKKSVPYLVTITPDGSFKKKAMVSSGDSETYIVPQVTYDVSEREFIIWGIWRKKNKFGRASID